MTQDRLTGKSPRGSGQGSTLLTGDAGSSPAPASLPLSISLERDGSLWIARCKYPQCGGAGPDPAVALTNLGLAISQTLAAAHNEHGTQGEPAAGLVLPHETLECDECGALKGKNTIDPYAAEIDNEEIEVVLCDDCYDMRAGGI